MPLRASAGASKWHIEFLTRADRPHIRHTGPRHRQQAHEKRASSCSACAPARTIQTDIVSTPFCALAGLAKVRRNPSV